MTDERWQAAWAIYNAAAQLPADERQDYVGSAVADDETAQRVMQMLEEMELPCEADSFSQSSTSGGGTGESGPNEEFSPGKTLGRFTITAFVGQGGMGRVYSAHDPDLNRSVAVKILSPRSSGSSSTVERFVREAQAASALNHPNIVTVYEVVCAEAVRAIVMELVAGKSLRAVCGVPNRVPDVAHWGLQIAQALAAAHANGIIHRDIKPENVVLRPDGYLKVLDFGLARQIGVDDSRDEIALGTVGYMSPEQIRQEPPTPASDVFSLGVVLYELASGSNPFADTSVLATTRSIEVKDPPSLLALANHKGIPQELDSLIRAMLCKEPMRDWVNTRQDAVEQARREFGADGVQVLNAFEVNSVPSLRDIQAGKPYKKTLPIVVDTVVPQTHCDLYSLSSWETWAPGKEDGVFDRLQYLASKAPHNAMTGANNLMLGKFGAHEAEFEDPARNYPVYVGDTSGAAFYAHHLMVNAALRNGVRYILFWEVYDNDLRMGGKHEGKGLPPGVMATAEQCVGNWLIRPDGSHTPTYDYFKALFAAEK